MQCLGRTDWEEGEEEYYYCQETAKAGTEEERLNTVDHVFYSRIAKRQPCQTQTYTSL